MEIAWNSHEEGAEVGWEIRYPGRIGPYPEFFLAGGGVEGNVTRALSNPIQSLRPRSVMIGTRTRNQARAASVFFR